jgi:hypothetical protein
MLEDWDVSDHPTTDEGTSANPSPLQQASRQCTPKMQRTRPAAGASAAASHRVKAGGGSTEACPIFVQFIDAVRQLVHIYPALFEFTPQLLIWLLDAYHSGFYATFSCDNVKELLESGLVGRHTANAFAELAQLGAVYPPTSIEPSPTSAEPNAAHNREAVQLQRYAEGAAAMAVRGANGSSLQEGLYTGKSPGSFVDVTSIAAQGDGDDGPNRPDSNPSDLVEETTPDRGAGEGRGESRQDGGHASTPKEDHSIVGSLVNHGFNWHYSAAQGPLTGLIGPHRITLWEEYYCRHSDGMQPLAVPARVAIPDGLTARRLSRQGNGANGTSCESFDNLSNSLADWQSINNSYVTSPNGAHGTPFPGRESTPHTRFAHSDDSPAPSSPGKAAAAARRGGATTQLRLPGNVRQTIQDAW